MLLSNGLALRAELELELELIQSHMTKKPMLRGEVGLGTASRPVLVSDQQQLKPSDDDSDKRRTTQTSLLKFRTARCF